MTVSPSKEVLIGVTGVFLIGKDRTLPIRIVDNALRRPPDDRVIGDRHRIRPVAHLHRDEVQIGLGFIRKTQSNSHHLLAKSDARPSVGHGGIGEIEDQIHPILRHPPLEAIGTALELTRG